MRVALVTLDFPPFRTSGLTVYAETLATGLRRHGHTVTVITSLRPEEKRTGEVMGLEDIRVVRLPIGSADWLGLGWQAARYLQAHKKEYEAVHFVDVHFAYAYPGRYTASALQSFRQRLTSSPGGVYHTSWRNRLFRSIYYRIARYAMERPSIGRALHVIATSDSTRREFIDHYHTSPAKISSIPIGINIRRFSYLLSKPVARKRLGLPADVFLMLYVGFSTPRKGVEHLAQALSILPAKPHLVMVGKWEAGYLERFMAALGNARDQVTIAGYVSDSDLLAYFAAADLFVLPTLLEGFGIPIVEAMAAGLPIVTTSAGSAAEVAGDSGIVVPPADSRSLAVALDQIIQDPQLASRLAELGRNRAKMFESDRVSIQFEQVFSQTWELR